MALRVPFEVPLNVPSEYEETVSDILYKMQEHVDNRGPRYQWSLNDFDIGAQFSHFTFFHFYSSHTE